MAAVPESSLRRGEEVRCPACLRFKAPHGMCPTCGCGEVPLERHGAARTLLQAGVDRFALAQRVAALEPGQAEWMEQQYAAQWEKAWPLLEEVRRCEEHLLQKGFVEDTVDQLAALMPGGLRLVSPEGGPPEHPETLEGLFAKGASWEVRQLAGLALVHRGEVSQELSYLVRSCLSDDRERIRVEAALAASRWRVFEWIRIGVKGWEQVREIARRAMAQPELTARAAVAWARASRGKDLEVDVLFALRQGLEHPDSDVRFECALCLNNEAELLAALESQDTRKVSRARRVLTTLRSTSLFEQLVRRGDAGFVRDVVATLPQEVPDEALEALLSRSEQGPGRLTEALLPLVEGRPFAGWSKAAQDRWSYWARVVLPGAPPEAALRLLRWVGEPPVAAGPARVFVEATAETLARAPADVRARSLEDIAFSRFLALAGPQEEPLLNQWAREAESGAPLAQALMTLTSRLQDWQAPPEQAARVLNAVWEGPGRQALLEPLKQAVRDWSGIVGRVVLIDAVWQRFHEHPDERADLLFVFAPWRQELWERQLASPEDAVARFQAWWHVDPEGFARQADLLMQDAPVDELPRRVQCVLSAAADVVMHQPRTTSLAVFYAAAGLANAFRAGADELAPEVERFLEWFPGFERRVQTTPPETNDRAPRRDFLEELHTEVRLMRERLEALREEADLQWQEELRRKVEESRRRDMERQAREAEQAAEEARRKAEEARRVLEAQRAEQAAHLAATLGQTSEPEPAARKLRPRIDSKSIDMEIIFPGKALPTLLDYARLLKTLGLGDPLKALSSAGLDMAGWVAEATAWGQALTGRLELGLRFGELMTAPWE